MARYADQAAQTVRRLLATPGWRRIAALRPELDAETVTLAVDAAAGLAEQTLAPLDPVADRQGCRLDRGRVVTPDGYGAAWRTLARAGWIGIDLPEIHGGQGLPLALQAACQPLLDRACPAFMMAAGASRCAARLLAAVADADTARDWIPMLVAGAWAATICISEPDAGSDVGRIRTAARRTADGWRVTGTKTWISFGDHDLAERIGHCLLARSGSDPGTRGLSLFLVPDRHPDGTRNGVTVERIEEKMGLHGSPTCTLRFADAQAVPLGTEGRGLAALFAMIAPMRLLTGCQGLGIAFGAHAVARRYAGERRQGGAPDAEQPPIASHDDVRRQLIAIESDIAILQAATLELATAMDLADSEPDPDARTAHAAAAAWMLPLIKTFGAETGFNAASAAIQLLGGAGYTREWPVEQALRDSRVLTIYEGTTGMQALDFLKRRHWADGGAGLATVLARMRQEITACRAVAPAAADAAAIVDAFAALAAEMLGRRDTPRRGEYGADGFLRAGWLCMSAWMAARLCAGDTAGDRRLGAFRLATLADDLAQAAARCRTDSALADGHFADAG
ncbi:MAG: acyl-CoA dehydrogenase family protein [Alphaproteobacteria bacterium]